MKKQNLDVTQALKEGEKIQEETAKLETEVDEYVEKSVSAFFINLAEQIP